MMPRRPAEWVGSDEAFVRCLSDFAANVLEVVAARCDSMQRFELPDPRFNDGVVAATLVVMALASELRHTNRPSSEWAPLGDA